MGGNINKGEKEARWQEVEEIKMRQQGDEEGTEAGDEIEGVMEGK